MRAKDRGDVLTVLSLDDLYTQLVTPAEISLDSSRLDPGIDNYHADIEVSPEFSQVVRDTLDLNLKRMIDGKSPVSGNTEEMVEVRRIYVDLMKVTMHRSKTDLHVGQIYILQFAVIKLIVQELRAVVDGYVEKLEEAIGKQQHAGSRALMTTQEKLVWFRKRSDHFSYRLLRHYFRLLQREENNQLKGLREQILGQMPQAVSVLCNPLLTSQHPREALMLLDNYAVWPQLGQGFAELNSKLEEILSSCVSEYPFTPLKNEAKLEAAQAEVYDELGGLFASQILLGPSEDQKDIVSETFSWVEHPDNIRLLFDESVHERLLEEAKNHQSYAKNRQFKNDLKKLSKAASDMRKSLGDNKALKSVLASYALRDKLSPLDLDVIDLEDALAIVSGTASRKPAELVESGQEGSQIVQAKLSECAAEFDKMFRDAPEDLFLRFLMDYSKYRLHLRYYRFAHRVFNRLSIVSDPDKIQLARAGGNLYQLMTSQEVKDAQAEQSSEVVHHTILKADVRGSTTVTAELMKQDLNPASYFSLRFFGPINESLATYGAVKVFLEGDAVILGTYEYGDSPNEWFSVSRACGIAKEILDIVALKNAHSRQTGLPLLEIGIGICYSDDRPLFLFDEDRPIMISSAIGDADRMSGCSWRLRETYDSGNFNVGAMLMSEDDRQKGEKGQELIRYNVNGIVVDDAAFAKLEKEVHFTLLKAKLADREEVFYVGQYPDVAGKERDLVIRRGKVGLLKEDKVDAAYDTGQFYYEVIPNGKLANRVVALSAERAAR